MAEIIPRQVTRYYCSACGRGWQRKGMAKNHAEKCWRDPANRACPTCTHLKGKHYSESPGCDLGRWYHDDSWHRDCKDWAAALDTKEGQ